MKLNSPKRLFRRSISGILHISRRSNNLTVIRNSRNGIAVAHPDLRVFFKTFKQRILRIYGLQISTSVFSCTGLLNRATITESNELRAITNSEHRIFSYNFTQITLEGVFIMNGIRRAAQDNTDDRRVILRKLVVWQNFAERVQLSHTTTNKLRGL